MVKLQDLDYDFLILTRFLVKMQEILTIVLVKFARLRMVQTCVRYGLRSCSCWNVSLIDRPHIILYLIPNTSNVSCSYYLIHIDRHIYYYSVLFSIRDIFILVYHILNSFRRSRYKKQESWHALGTIDPIQRKQNNTTSHAKWTLQNSSFF